MNYSLPAFHNTPLPDTFISDSFTGLCTSSFESIDVINKRFVKSDGFTYITTSMHYREALTNKLYRIYQQNAQRQYLRFKICTSTNSSYPSNFSKVPNFGKVV